MAPRANWKGHLKLSLVSCAVAMYPATSTGRRIRFNVVNRRTGHRIKNQVVDERTGEPVADEDRAKGYKIEGGAYVLLDDQELDEVALESTHTIDIESFVPREEVDVVYLDAPYYLVPDDRVSTEAFAVIRDAMSGAGVVALARVVMYRRERMVMIEPRGRGLLATTLHYRDEVRTADAYFDDVRETEVTPDMLDLAAHIVRTKGGHFDPTRFEDRYERALAELIEAKRAGAVVVPAPTRADNVIDLMDALRRSVAQSDGPAERASPVSPAPSKPRTPRTGRGPTGSDGPPARRPRSARPERRKRKTG